ncbi:MAG: DUF362 domain-containing protein, partial [Candidatus Scalindua sp.]|nr:DUF362 domain-containing protein [Candidatus Scalindua sp.]
MSSRVALDHFDKKNLKEKIRECLEWVNWKDRIYPDSRIYVKPNLTFPDFRPGVTTSPHFLAAALSVLKERTPHITVFESDGGNNSYPAEKAFETHNLYDICGSMNVRLINLSREERINVEIPTPHGKRVIPLSKEIVEQADMTISIPVPKMHFVVRYTGAIKNHWGTIPDSMRLRNHHFFNDAITEIMKILKSGITIVDGEYFLDKNGPVSGDPVKMNLVMTADSPLSADMALMSLMDVDPHKIGYIHTAWKKEMGPKSINDIEFNSSLEKFRTHSFSYQRDPVDYLALLGFKSKLVTWVVYLSPLRNLIHKLVRLLRGKSKQVDTYYTGID